jgi:hypothetical protein
VVVSVDASGCPDQPLKLSDGGVYSLPAYLQQHWWTTGQGYQGPIAAGRVGQVFAADGQGRYVTADATTPGASGLEVTVTWRPDFAGDGSDFDFGKGVQTDMVADSISVNGAGERADPVFGHQFAVGFSGLQFNADSINTSGGYYNVMLRGTDIHVSRLTPVGGQVSLDIRDSTSIDLPSAVFDTPKLDFLEIDHSQNVRLTGRLFHNATPSTIARPAIVLGGRTNSADKANVLLDIDLLVTNAGVPPGGSPAMSIAYTHGSHVNLNVSNAKRDGTRVAYPHTAWAEFGPGVQGDVFTGQVEGVSGPIFSGRPAASWCQVFNADAGRMEGC